MLRLQHLRPEMPMSCPSRFARPWRPMELLSSPTTRRWPLMDCSTRCLLNGRAWFVQDGQHVYVTQAPSGGWWQGRLPSGDEGWFPSNHVTPDPIDLVPRPRPGLRVPPSDAAAMSGLAAPRSPSSSRQAGSSLPGVSTTPRSPSASRQAGPSIATTAPPRSPAAPRQV